MPPTPRRPLHHVTPTELYIRVAHQLVLSDYRKQPKAYGAFPANRIASLAREMRAGGFPVFFPWLEAAARHVAEGVPLRVWAASMPWDWNRSVFKQSWRRSR